ncbi:O-antigen ligase family protein [Stenotrophomonas sp. TWI169]|uniref:O-antigen ligase family protein n=1 Tax=Stenotrophomonas TaxID=40323 RepID=UPI002ACCEEF1|nr:O-antigen ligase family protein [Stenotrophomonas maltophilia]MDZ5841072.1 O-antigen ligase family protein [Stenotrophomonas maltophilia]
MSHNAEPAAAFKRSAPSAPSSRHEITSPLASALAKLILLITPALIVVDTLNGALMREFGISALSQVVKVSYLALLAVYAIHTRQGVIALCACIITNSIFILAHTIPGGTISSIAADAQWLLRFNILWLGFYCFKRMTRQGKIDDAWLRGCFTFVSIILAINLVLGTIGLGYSQYGKYSDSEQIGAVGFIFAGNEMSFLMLLCQSVICGFVYHRQRATAFYLLICCLFLAAAILKATKVAILGSAIIALAFPGIEVLRGLLRFRMGSLRGLIIGFFSLLFVVTAAPIVLQLIESSGLLGRMQYFLREYGLLFTIFSGREQFLQDFLGNVWPNYTLFEKMLGAGRQEMLLRLGRPVEIDAADLLGAFGVAGVILYYGPFIFGLIKSSRSIIYPSASLTTAFIISSILILISLTAGHVIYSGLAAPYLAVAFGYLLNREPLLSAHSSASQEDSGDGRQ